MSEAGLPQLVTDKNRQRTAVCLAMRLPVIIWLPLASTLWGGG